MSPEKPASQQPTGKRINGEIAVNIVIKTISFVLPEPGLNGTLSATKK